MVVLNTKRLVPDAFPFAIEEKHGVGGQEFLESPSSLEPFAPSELLTNHIGIIVLFYIEEIGEAEVRIVIPSPHGINSLGEFGAG